MRSAKALLVFLLLVLFFLTSCGDSKTTSGPSTSPKGPTNSTVVSLVALVNSHRADIGCPALIWDGPLADVATAHSEEMKENNYLNHTDLSGNSPFDRMVAAGITFSAAAENIAMDDQGAQSTFDAWMNSAGHKANIENCTYTHHGVGLVGAYWTHMFMLPN